MSYRTLLVGTAQLIDAMAKAHCLLALAALAQAEIIVPVGAEQGGTHPASIHVYPCVAACVNLHQRACCREAPNHAG